jgi:hypothetical protein
MINKAIILFLILVLNNMNMNGSGYEPSNLDLLKDSLKNAPTIKLKNENKTYHFTIPNWNVKLCSEYSVCNSFPCGLWHGSENRPPTRQGRCIRFSILW